MTEMYRFSFPTYFKLNWFVAHSNNNRTCFSFSLKRNVNVTHISSVGSVLNLIPWGYEFESLWSYGFPLCTRFVSLPSGETEYLEVGGAIVMVLYLSQKQYNVLT